MRPGSVNVAAALLATTLRLYEKQLKRDLAKADAALTSSIADDTRLLFLSLSVCRKMEISNLISFFFNR